MAVKQIHGINTGYEDTGGDVVPFVPCEMFGCGGSFHCELRPLD